MEPLQKLFNLSLLSVKVPVLWKIYFLVPVLKIGRPVEVNDNRPVVLTSHIMKTLGVAASPPYKATGCTGTKLASVCLPGTHTSGVEDTALMLHWAYAYLDMPGSYVRIMFFDFSSVFNTIQPLIVRDKLRSMRVAPSLTSWSMDYLTARLHLVRLGKCVSMSLECSMGALQGTGLAVSVHIVHIQL